MEIRKKCVICLSVHMEDIYKIESMPVFMGASNNKDHIYHDHIVMECQNCGCLQNKFLIDPKLVYMNNHNVEIVGKTWKDHFDNLASFINSKCDDGLLSKSRIILEIGDPSGKLANLIHSLAKKWIIVEPNPDYTKTNHIKNVQIIKEYFSSTTDIDESIDLIIHSHFIEHTYNPREFLDECYNKLKVGGEMIFSFPNMRHILESKYIPSSVLHFEHTFYLDDQNIYSLLGVCGFKIQDLKYYKNHSIFVHSVKTERKRNTFLNNSVFHKNNIEQVKLCLNKENMYLYGGHINSQYLLANGIDETKFKCVLDGSSSKIGKYLYGTNLLIKSPEEVKDVEDPLIVTFHMGVYSQEINYQLKKINIKCIII